MPRPTVKRNVLKRNVLDDCRRTIRLRKAAGRTALLAQQKTLAAAPGLGSDCAEIVGQTPSPFEMGGWVRYWASMDRRSTGAKCTAGNTEPDESASVPSAVTTPGSAFSSDVRRIADACFTASSLFRDGAGSRASFGPVGSASGGPKRWDGTDVPFAWRYDQSFFGNGGGGSCRWIDGGCRNSDLGSASVGPTTSSTDDAWTANGLGRGGGSGSDGGDAGDDSDTGDSDTGDTGDGVDGDGSVTGDGSVGSRMDDVSGAGDSAGGSAGDGVGMRAGAGVGVR